MFNCNTSCLVALPDITVYMNCDTRLAINLSMFDLGDNDEFIFAIKNYDYIDSAYVFLFRARKTDINEQGEVIFKITPRASKRLKPGAFYNFALLANAYEQSVIDTIVNNSLELKSKITFYSLERKQIIPKVEVYDYQKTLSYFDEAPTTWPTIYSLLLSDDIQERYWINECLQGLINKELWNNEYISRIEIEADILRFISGKLEDSLFAYFNTFKHYIDLFWNCGSIVGPGRGSATGFLSNYLLGITQLDPIRWNLPYWRFLNKERAELPSLLLILGSCKKRTLTIA